jgi:sec-independent protein translocase protein TatC
MELTEHLDELRDRLLWCVAAFLLGVVAVGLPANGVVLHILQLPIQEAPLPERNRLRVSIGADGVVSVPPATLAKFSTASKGMTEGFPGGWDRGRLEIAMPNGDVAVWGVDFGNQLFFFDPMEPIILRLKLAVWIGFLVALPVFIVQGWRFLAPGLTPKERSFIKPLFLAGALLFPIGSMFAYFGMKYAIFFLLDYAADFVPAIGLKSFISFQLLMMIVMGAVFEFPVLLLGLARLGIVDPDRLADNRPYIVTGLMVFSAVMTPPDPFTMILMGAPLWILYELSLWLARLPFFKPGEDLVASRSDEEPPPAIASDVSGASLAPDEAGEGSRSEVDGPAAETDRDEAAASSAVAAVPPGEA